MRGLGSALARRGAAAAGAGAGEEGEACWWVGYRYEAASPVAVEKVVSSGKPPGMALLVLLALGSSTMVGGWSLESRLDLRLLLRRELSGLRRRGSLIIVLVALMYHAFVRACVSLTLALCGYRLFVKSLRMCGVTQKDVQDGPMFGFRRDSSSMLFV